AGVRRDQAISPTTRWPMGPQACPAPALPASARATRIRRSQTSAPLRMSRSCNKRSPSLHQGVPMHTFTLFNNEPDTLAVSEGQVIFNEGERADCMYAVIEGEVEIVRGSHVLETVPPGGVFGEMGILDHIPRSA